MSGNIKKGSRYRSVLLENIDDSHPINQGIFMQVHHLISEKAIRDSGIGAMLVAYDYDINSLENLVALPSTLPGACHLEVQLHRGDHKTPFRETFDQDDNDSDDNHPLTYHKFIRNKLKESRNNLRKSCGEDKKITAKRVKNEMDNLSSLILERVERFNLPLTEIFNSFDNEEGCKNALTIGEHKNRSTPCTKEGRNHMGSEHAYSKATKPETISFTKNNYRLSVGR